MITAHARIRMRQRSVSKRVLELLLSYGSSQHDHHGAEIFHFDRAAIRRLARTGDCSVIQRLASRRRTYAVVSRGQVITVGYRRKRIRRH